MKVVLFCGGLGMRLREYSEAIPKPMVPIGHRPMLWNIMKYYAHFGHNDFILCLGWQGAAIKHYFLNYDECASNDFVLSGGGQVDLLASDIHDWRITFVDTGLTASIGQRLKQVQRFVAGEERFLANYSDGLTDLHLPTLIDFADRQDTVATCVNVRPNQSFHIMRSDEQGLATDMLPVAGADVWMNGGYFVLKQEVFDYLHEGEDLMADPARRLIAERQFSVFKHDGFWGSMDTYKEKQQLDDMHNRGETPWAVWKTEQPAPAAPPKRSVRAAARPR
jgi:glucose-1-phosphate cytidylyltransferase